MLMNQSDLKSVTDVVLMSGGWESTLCAVRLKQHMQRTTGGPLIVPLLLFFDYGQHFARNEELAVQAVSRRLGIQYRKVELVRGTFALGADVIPCRNSHFIHLSRRIAPNASGLWFGCRAPSPAFDRYKDSNVQWAQYEGRVQGYQRVYCPAMLMPKYFVKRAVRRAGIVEGVVFSSEGLVA